MHKRMRAGKLATRLRNLIHSGPNARASIIGPAWLRPTANPDEALDKDQPSEVGAKGVNVSRKRSLLLFGNNKGGKKSSRGLFDLSQGFETPKRKPHERSPEL